MKPKGSEPWLPAPYKLPDVGALQALDRGDAEADQQRRALTFIIETICKTYDLSYRPDSERDTAFAEGKRYVGTQIVKLLKLNMKALRTNG